MEGCPQAGAPLLSAQPPVHSHHTGPLLEGSEPPGARRGLSWCCCGLDTDQGGALGHSYERGRRGGSHWPYLPNGSGPAGSRGARQSASSRLAVRLSSAGLCTMRAASCLWVPSPELTLVWGATPRDAGAPQPSLPQCPSSPQVSQQPLKATECKQPISSCFSFLFFFLHLPPLSSFSNLERQLGGGGNRVTLHLVAIAVPLGPDTPTSGMLERCCVGAAGKTVPSTRKF